MKKIILLFIILMMINSISVEATDEWRQYQYDNHNTGIYEGSYEGFYDDGIESFSYKFKGSDNQPLFIDINNDSINEYLTIDGNDFIFYNVSDQNKLQIQFQFSTGHTMINYRYTYFENKLIVIANENIYNGDSYINIYEWNNNSNILNVTSINYVRADRTITSGISCEYIYNLGGNYCFFYVEKRSGTGGEELIRYNISGHNIDWKESYHTGSNIRSPIICDLKNDDDQYVYSATSSSTIGGYITRSSATILSKMGSSLGLNKYPTGLSVQDIDGGYKELIASYYETTANKEAHITIRNYALSEQYHITIDNYDPITYSIETSNHLYADFIDDDEKELCIMAHITSISSDDAYYIYCGMPDETFGIKMGISVNEADSYYFNPDIPIISAKMRQNINDKYSIITGSAIFFVDESKIISLDSQDQYGVNGLNDNYPIITDINNNGLIDICSSGTDETFCTFNIFKNENAFYIGSFGATTPRKYEQSEINTIIYEDVCINSNHTFFTAECTESELYRCNYVNDVKSDYERLQLTCPEGSPIITEYYDNEINFSCNFSILGTYKFPVFIQDKKHEDDLTEFKYIKVTVTNGSKYIDCDLAVNIYDILPLNETETIQKNKEGTEDIHTGSTAIGDYCIKDSDCITGKCMAHQCVYRLFGDSCINDEMCLSGKCVNGRCNKPSMSQLANQMRKENFGNDDDTNIIIGMLICIGGMLFIIAVGRNIIACIIGAVYYFTTSTAFVMLRWMPSFVFFINIFVGVICIILYFCFKGD